MKITLAESMFYQALAMTALLGELSSNNFLESGYYNDKCFIENNVNNRSYKEILEKSGIGNPATLQILLYILLVIPKEMLKKNDPFLCEMKEEINKKFKLYVHRINTTYPGESNNDLNSIDFYKHTRNAVSHSNCFYTQNNKINYVSFKDINIKDGSKCEFSLKTGDMSIIITELQKQIMIFLNRKRFENLLQNNRL